MVHMKTKIKMGQSVTVVITTHAVRFSTRFTAENFQDFWRLLKLLTKYVGYKKEINFHRNIVSIFPVFAGT